MSSRARSLTTSSAPSGRSAVISMPLTVMSVTSNPSNFTYRNRSSLLRYHSLDLKRTLPVGEIGRKPRCRRENGGPQAPVLVEAALTADALEDELAHAARVGLAAGDRKSTRLNSSHVATSYAVFCLKRQN